MTHLETIVGSNGLYAVPADADWLSSLLRTSSERADIFVALNVASANLIAASDPEAPAKAALAAALGLPKAKTWHNDTNPLRTPDAARAACAALMSSGYQP